MFTLPSCGSRRPAQLRRGEHVVVIGAGPAGLTAAYVLAKSGVRVTVLEADAAVGGLSRTVQYNGYRFDIGGHRFFTKMREVRLGGRVLMQHPVAELKCRAGRVVSVLTRTAEGDVCITGDHFISTMPLRSLSRGTSVVDAKVVRVPKAYPIYNSTFRRNLDIIRDHLDGLANLHTVGRNGMHKYNNQDHSMMAALLAIRTMQGGSEQRLRPKLATIQPVSRVQRA